MKDFNYDDDYCKSAFRLVPLSLSILFGKLVYSCYFISTSAFFSHSINAHSAHNRHSCIRTDKDTDTDTKCNNIYIE